MHCRILSADQSAWFSHSFAATAAICGTAILVPDSTVNPPNWASTGIYSPGADSSTSAPCTEQSAGDISALTPPTAMTSSYAAGYNI